MRAIAARLTMVVSTQKSRIFSACQGRWGRGEEGGTGGEAALPLYLRCPCASMDCERLRHARFDGGRFDACYDTDSPKLA